MKNQHNTKYNKLSFAIMGVLSLTSASALSAEAELEVIEVTAQKRVQNIKEVPASITAIKGDVLSSKLSGGESILAIASIAPGVYAESSGGRSAPRFYMRGLGNADFNVAASQPVSIVFDDVPMEKSALKSFPLFDQERVEVIRGPQGSLFGRNTTAGILKFDSARPEDSFSGYVKSSLGNLGMFNVEGAVSGALIDGTLNGRLSLLSQERSDWISNDFTGEEDALGGFEEFAGRAQLEWTPTDDLNVLFMHQTRDNEGSASVFRANILSKGSNELNSNFDRDRISFDGGNNNFGSIKSSGTTLKIEWDLGDYAFTSVSSYHEAERYSRGDIDGGFGCGFCGQETGPGFIPFSVDTASNSDVEQFTQELRITSNFDGAFNYQYGVFYFKDELDADSMDTRDAVAPSDIGVRSNTFIENTTWAVFGQGSYDFTSDTTLTAGIRYTEDEKEASYMIPPTSGLYGLYDLDPIEVDDSKVSWDIAISHAVNEDTQIFSRIASSFRAPTIQTGLNDDPTITTADSEDILSYEVGIKVDLWEKVRINAAVFHYIIDDIQLTAVGGKDNSVRLLNAEEGTGTGIEFDIEYIATPYLVLSGGFGYNKTSINDKTLSTATCGFNLCTVTDPVDADGNAFIDGNPFQHSPKWTVNFEIEYNYPLTNDSELFLLTDWKVKGETNDFLYESIEYKFDSQFEGGVRVGYRSFLNEFEVAIFARNITDEENIIGGIDFNNLTAYVNEPRVFGIEVKYDFY